MRAEITHGAYLLDPDLMRIRIYAEFGRIDFLQSLLCDAKSGDSIFRVNSKFVMRTEHPDRLGR